MRAVREENCGAAASVTTCISSAQAHAMAIKLVTDKHNEYKDVLVESKAQKDAREEENENDDDDDDTQDEEEEEEQEEEQEEEEEQTEEAIEEQQVQKALKVREAGDAQH